MAINANVSGGQQITANVGETKIDVAVSGGVGPTGTPGAAASVQVGTVTTGAPGSSASVVNAGSSSAAVLNFTIPAGATGATGATGPQGERGEQGIQGIQGIQGPAGATGATGPAGSNATATTDASALVSGILPDARLSSSIARTADVTAAVASVVGAAPESLNTLQELSAALANDASFSATVTNSLAAKAPINNPTFTGTVGGISAAMVGLGNVNNTSDAAKPVSTAQAAADAAVASAAAADATTKANAAQAAAVQRANHTGTQAVSTVSGLQAALDAKASLAGAEFTGSIDVTGELSVEGPATVGSLVSLTSMQGRTLVLVNAGLRFSVDSLGKVVVGTWEASAIGVAYGGTGATTASAARTNLGLAIGTDVAAASHTQAWSTITATPTTLSGYGITDAVASSDARLTDARTPLAHNQAWSTITSTPTTLAGYGITDAAALSHTHSASAITDFASAVAAASPEEVVEFLTPAQFPATGNSSLLYIATDNARAYRWVGSQYAEIGPAGAFLPVHSHAASEITSGTLDAARLPSSGVSASSLTVGTVAEARLPNSVILHPFLLAGM